MGNRRPHALDAATGSEEYAGNDLAGLTPLSLHPSLFTPHGCPMLRRSSRFRILPLAFFGSLSTKTTRFGTLNPASRSRQNAINTSASRLSPVRSTAAAVTASIHSG